MAYLRCVARAMGPKAKDDTQEKLEALMCLAREFATEKPPQPLQAIKCFEAICNKTHMNVLPLPEARARVQLSYLLLEFTDNVHRAKTHLETTVRPMLDEACYRFGSVRRRKNVGRRRLEFASMRVVCLLFFSICNLEVSCVCLLSCLPSSVSLTL